MAEVIVGGNTIHTRGDLPEIGTKAPDFELIDTDLKRHTLADYAGKRVVMNIFPSLETGTCAASVRQFNQIAAGLENTTVLCISRDLPMAQKRFCGAEGIENVVLLSDYSTGKFGKDYNLDYLDGALPHLLSRVVIILDEEGVIRYTQQVKVIADEPDYDDVLSHL